MDRTKVYRLRQLINEKYGEDKFALGCELVARFVGFKSEHTWTAEDVRMLCSDSNRDANVGIEDYRRFGQLFGMETIGFSAMVNHIPYVPPTGRLNFND